MCGDTIQHIPENLGRILQCMVSRCLKLRVFADMAQTLVKKVSTSQGVSNRKGYAVWNLA